MSYGIPLMATSSFTLRLRWNSGGFDFAVGTDAVKEELVPGNAEAARQLWLERRDTSRQLIEFFALIALEVMVMRLPCHFIPGRIARDINGFEPALIDQRLNVAIDSCLAQSRMMALRALQNLIRGQWPVSVKEGVADSRFLPCLDASLHWE
jgi:hypothetical protein